MGLLLTWIRYILILIPGIATMVLEEIDSYSVYMTAILISILWIRVREKWFFAARWAALFEVGYYGYISNEYGGLLFLLLLSTVISVFHANFEKEWRLSITVLLAAVMNVTIIEYPLDMKFVSNIIFVSITAILFALETESMRNRHAEILFDELSSKHYELERARQRLLDYAKQVEYYAQVEERNRISKEIHDDLGHRLIRLKIMLEAAIHISPTRPEEAMGMIRQVRDQLTDGMETLRATVRGMAPKELHSKPYSLEKLSEEAWADSGIKITYHMEGLPCPLYPSLELILYRNAQEAVTNAIRHGQATEIEIALLYHPHCVELRVSNNGKVPESKLIRKGFGIRGMEERIALLGGRLEIATEECFTIKTIIPFPTYRDSEQKGVSDI